MRVPLLKMKLQTLYRSGLASEVHNHASLANALGISRSAVSPWVRDDVIPDERVVQVCRLFGISRNVLLNVNIEEDFANAVVSSGNAWATLCAQALSTETDIHFVDVDMPSTRDLVVECDRALDDAVAEISLGTRLKIEIRGMPGWSVAVLLHHPTGYRCLSLATTTDGHIDRLEDRVFFPRSGFFRVSPPMGRHTIIAVITLQSPPRGIQHDLAEIQEDPRRAIGSVRAWLQTMHDDDYILLRRDFNVTPARHDVARNTTT